LSWPCDDAIRILARKTVSDHHPRWTGDRSRAPLSDLSFNIMLDE
jgi:hypothetical protein